MGTHKKSKKARNRSRSRSRDSEYIEGRKSKRSRRRRSSSRSSSSGSKGGDRCRSPSRTPERKRKKKSKKSRSRSKERYTERVRHTRSRSRSKERRGTRRSRSRSASGSRSRQRSRSSSRSKKSRRSRSRSRSSDRLSKLGSRSKETSKTASPLPFKDVKDSPSTAERPLESLQEKMQRALEAAATADAQLRQQGILTSVTKNEILSQKEERDRQKQLASIEKDSFHMKSFQSSQGANPVKAQQPVIGISRDWTHDSAMFSTNNISDLQNAARYLDSVQPKRNGKLASDFLSASKEEKEERWFLKLQALRKQRLEGKPLAGRKQKDEPGRNGR